MERKQKIHFFVTVSRDFPVISSGARDIATQANLVADGDVQ